MKWVVVALILCLATFCRGGALKCTLGSKDEACVTREKETTKAEDVPRNREEEEAECLAGSEWESNCHNCRCSDAGMAVCSRLETCEKSDAEPIRCKPETSYKRDCNTCRCMKNGLSLCTLKGCLSSTWSLKCTLGSKDEACVTREKETTKVEDVPRNREEEKAECLAGSEWESNCHNCRCSDAGMAVCSRLETCEKSDAEPIRCKPETSYKRDCNTCRCMKNGLSLCTRKGCLSSTWFLNPVFEAKKSDEVEPESHHNLVKRSTVCIPGSKYIIECNTCLCSRDGQSFTCTLLACFMGDSNTGDVELFKEDEERISKEQSDESEVKACKPRSTFNMGCNTCLCNIDGSNYSCTNKPCPLPDDVEIFHELRVLRSPAKSVVCAANRMFVKDCNTCWCNEDGTSYFCTRKVCVDDLPEEVPEMPIKIHEVNGSCRPDEVFELDCNMCRCNADGRSFSCTRRVCPVEEDLPLKRRTRSTSQQSTRTAEAPHFEKLIKGTPKNCQPGQEFRMDCNMCLCDNEGQNFSCTRIDCAALNSNNNGGTRVRREVENYIQTNCTPGTMFSQNCNTCHCTADGGHAICTIKQCNNNEGELNLPESDPNFRCNPGEQFQRNCNDCTCSADGKSIFCTLRLCDI